MRRFSTVATAAMLAVALWVSAPALSLDPYVPRAVDFSMAVPDSALAPARAASAQKKAAVSPVLEAPKRFDLVGLHWRRGEGAVQLRFRKQGGTWTEWVRTAQSHDHAPDGARRPEGSDPIWVGGADELQMRVRGSLRGVRAHFVNTTGTATAGDRAKTAIRRAVHSAFVAAARTASAHAASTGGKPDIVGRDAWGAEQCQPRSAPEYGTVKAAFIHHTVNANDYSPEDSAAIVLAICRFHKNSNGWNDVGYNFLVDRHGQIFEGRAGGVDQAVLGAQAQGYNAQSLGIANLGTFSDEPQTDAALKSLASLISWKMAVHAQPVTGTVTLTSAGGGSSRAPAGTTLSFERVSGHRDANATECPGAALYDQIPTIRGIAAGQYVAPTGLVTSAGARRISFPAPVQLSGRLNFVDGAPEGDFPIEIQFRVAGGSYSRAGEVTTTGDGSWFAQIKAERSGFYRARFAGDGIHPVMLSAPVGVTVVPKLVITPAAKAAFAGGRMLVTGSIAPVKRNLLIEIERLDGRRWKFLGRQPVRTRADGGYRAFVNIGTPRRYRLRVSFTSDRVNPSVRSSPVVIQGRRTVGGTLAR